MTMVEKSDAIRADVAKATPPQKELPMATDTIETKLLDNQSVATPNSLIDKTLIWGGLMGNSAEAFVRATQETIDLMMACSEANISFGLDRTHKACDLLQTSMEIRDTETWIRVASEHQRVMYEDYGHHAQRTLNMMLGRAHEMANTFEERAQTALSEVKKAA
jgi:hypothetical protein